MRKEIKAVYRKKHRSGGEIDDEVIVFVRR